MEARWYLSIHSRKEAVLSRVLELKLALLSPKALLPPLRRALNWGNVYGLLLAVCLRKAWTGCVELLLQVYMLTVHASGF